MLITVLVCLKGMSLHLWIKFHGTNYDLWFNYFLERWCNISFQWLDNLFDQNQTIREEKK